MTVCAIFQYLYAFSVAPMSSMDYKELIQQPEVATNCPYTELVRSMVSECSVLYSMFINNQPALRPNNSSLECPFSKLKIKICIL